ncbi:hypothetical protein Tco_0868477 [Tanacetum coccineum]
MARQYHAYLATQPNGSQVVHEDLDQIHEDDLDEIDLKWQLALLSMKARKFYQRTGKKKIINGSDTAGYDKKKRTEAESRQLREDSVWWKKLLLSYVSIDGTDLMTEWLGLLVVLNSPYFMVKSWLVHDQTVLGQTATGKESSNPFMAEAKYSEVCKITRADGTSSFHEDFQALLRRIDRQDLFQLYSLVQERYKHSSIEGHDLDLWGYLKMMFDPNEEDDIWLNQHYWELLRWKLHEHSSVHSLFLDGTSIQINMLVDKKYPLKKEILKKMIKLKIKAEEDSDMASELIKFIKS